MVYIIENEDGYYIQEERFSKRILDSNNKIIESFIQTKKLEGLSEKTLHNYHEYIRMLSYGIGKKFEDITTKDLRVYMTNYQIMRKIKNDSMDNMRRVFSTFYSYLEEENYILKNPVKKIHKIKGEKNIKTSFSEEEIILIQDVCTDIREVALIDFLYSTGVRVSELCELNIENIDFDKREAVVFGKGVKERIAYFDSRTKIHLQKYINSREDNNKALFVSSIAPYNRLTKSGVEYIIAEIGMRSGVEKCHPHRFRRTLATRLIDRGVPIEQVQKILGHTKIETTLIYAEVNQCNVKISHNKFA